MDFFESVLKQKLTVSDTMDFLNLWYVMIVINDVLIILGTVSKVTIEFRDFDSDLFTLTGIMLGTGALLVYIGLLRYLGFFSGYNVRRALCLEDNNTLLYVRVSTEGRCNSCRTLSSPFGNVSIVLCRLSNATQLLYTLRLTLFLRA